MLFIITWNKILTTTFGGQGVFWNFHDSIRMNKCNELSPPTMYMHFYRMYSSSSCYYLCLNVQAPVDMLVYNR